MQENLRERAVLQTAFQAHNRKRREQRKRDSTLRKEFQSLVRRARMLNPPMSIYEIERLSGVPKSTVHDLLNEIPNMERSK